MEIFSEQYNKAHFLSRVDVRVKMIVMLAALIMVISCKGILFPMLIAGVSLGLCAAMRVPLRILLLRVAEPMLIALVVLLLKLFFSGEDVLFTVSIAGFDISGYSDGLLEGIRIVSRIIGGVSLVVLLGFSTPFAELMSGFAWMRLPRTMIEIMMFAYRYVFIFIEDAITIYQAQKNRLGYTGIRRGLNSFGTLTGSLIIRSFDQSQKTAEAMAQRGYTGEMPLVQKRPLKVFEVVTAVICIGAIGVLWIIQ